MRGILTLRQMRPSSSRAAPADLTAGAPGSRRSAPSSSYARVGTTTSAPTFPAPLTVTLSGPAQSNTTSTIVSGTPGALTVSERDDPDRPDQRGRAGDRAGAERRGHGDGDARRADADGARPRARRGRGAVDRDPVPPRARRSRPGAAPQLTVTLDVPALVATTVAPRGQPGQRGHAPGDGERRGEPDHRDVHVHGRLRARHGRRSRRRSAAAPATRP